MATYTNADKNTLAMVKGVLEEHYPELAEIKFRVSVLFANATRSESGEPKGPALKNRGWPCLAMIRKTSHKDRVAGLADAIIYLDGDQWPDLDEARQLALIDHELYHIELQRDESGAAQTDDCFRPVIKLKPHDWELGGFDEIVKRHKGSAAEARAFSNLHKRLVQGELFPCG